MSLKRHLFHSHGEPFIIYRPLITRVLILKRRQSAPRLRWPNKCALIESRAMRFIKDLLGTLSITLLFYIMGSRCKIKKVSFANLSNLPRTFMREVTIVIINDWMEILPEQHQTTLSAGHFGNSLWVTLSVCSKRSTVVGWSPATHWIVGALRCVRVIPFGGIRFRTARVRIWESLHTMLFMISSLNL